MVEELAKHVVNNLQLEELRISPQGEPKIFASMRNTPLDDAHGVQLIRLCKARGFGLAMEQYRGRPAWVITRGTAEIKTFERLFEQIERLKAGRII